MSKAQASSATPTAQSAAHHKGAGRCRRFDVHMVQNVLLIWLDGNIDENSGDYRNTIRHLRRIVNTINIFTDVEECID